MQDVSRDRREGSSLRGGRCEECAGARHIGRPRLAWAQMRDHRQVRRAFPLFIGLVLVPLLTVPAFAAAPNRIEIGDVVLDEGQAGRLYPSLCSDSPAGDTSDRPAVPVTVVWTVFDDRESTEELWRGTFYPRHGGRPAAINRPDWVAHGSGTERRCDRREVSSSALTILEAAGVAVSSGNLETSPSRHPWVVGVVLVGAGALVLALRRRSSRRATAESEDASPVGR